MKSSLFLGVVLAGFALSSCTWNSESSPAGSTNTGAVVIADTYTDTLKTTSDKIKESPEFTECMNMNVNMCVSRAATQIAQSTQSLEFCEELGSPDQVESCKFGITLSLSRSKGDIKICDEVSGDYKNRCVVEYMKSEAVNAKDTKLCGKILTISGESIDKERINRDVDQCITNIIMTDASKGAEACEDIEDMSMKQMCKSMKEPLDR